MKQEDLVKLDLCLGVATASVSWAAACSGGAWKLQIATILTTPYCLSLLHSLMCLAPGSFWVWGPFLQNVDLKWPYGVRITGGGEPLQKSLVLAGFGRSRGLWIHVCQFRFPALSCRSISFIKCDDVGTRGRCRQVLPRAFCVPPEEPGLIRGWNKEYLCLFFSTLLLVFSIDILYPISLIMERFLSRPKVLPHEWFKVNLSGHWVPC